MTAETSENTVCPRCGGAGRLTPAGVARVYLLPHPLCAATVVVGVILGLIHSPYGYLLAAAGFLWPLVNADLRLLLFPVVLVARLAGVGVTCPDCGPGGIFAGREPPPGENDSS